MKKFIKPSSFDAATGTVILSEPDFAIFRVISIINQTRGVLLYATASPALNYASYNNGFKSITVGIDTSTMDNGDDIQVVYESSEASESMAAVVTKQIAQGAVETFLNSGYTKMQIFNNPTTVASTVRWVLSHQTPSATEGAMLIPSAFTSIIPAGSINVFAVEDNADVTVVYYI